jgi:hypothetical protein
MRYVVGHPNVPLEDWQTFCQKVSPFLIKQVIERDKLEMAPFMVPLARGVGMASSYLLHKAGYNSRTRLPGLRKSSLRCFDLVTNNQPVLRVRNVGRHRGRSLWAVLRLGSRCDILVHQFGSTPIVAADHRAAMQLAIRCDQKSPPGLAWIQLVPKCVKSLMRTAAGRRKREARKMLSQRRLRRP